MNRKNQWIVPVAAVAVLLAAFMVLAIRGPRDTAPRTADNSPEVVYVPDAAAPEAAAPEADEQAQPAKQPAAGKPETATPTAPPSRTAAQEAQPKADTAKPAPAAKAAAPARAEASPKPAADAPKPEFQGPKAIPFTAKTTDGKVVSLSDYKGKVLLLDFWASWCPPCRAEAPNVVNVFNKYHEKGFEILGVSLDREKAPMNAFMKEMGMTWPEIYDQDNDFMMATIYGVEAIPAMLLIDGTTGRVLAENPRGPALEEAVSQAVARLPK